MRDLATNAAFLACILAASSVNGDVYMHNPRGNNNRNCRRTNDNNRENGNRLFDSQNNDAGGYACQSAKPFACYEDAAGGGCNNQRATVGPGGLTTDGDTQLLTPTEEAYFYEGSKLPIEWTSQHGGGENSNTLATVVIQMSCAAQLNDNCGDAAVQPLAATEPGMCPSNRANPNAATCTLRDGYVTRNQGNNRDDQATDRIGTNAADQSDYRYGRNENLAYYQACENRERNMGLWIADQNLATNDATSTRQNPDANRYGLECAEEANYYPYWHDSPWMDLAVITYDESLCEYYKAESQNVKPRGRCDCTAAACQGAGQLPNNEAACTAKGGNWCMDAAFNMAPPECMAGPRSRENQLGNDSEMGAVNPHWNLTIPTLASLGVTGNEERCVVRVRYNITNTSGGGVAVNGDSTSNGNNGPIYDNDENEELSYRTVAGAPGPNAKLGMAVNTNQYGRNFQDRSYTFVIKPAPANVPAGATIYNLNVRGKRGNIVQSYPAVEFDYVPQRLMVTENDFIHYQTMGTDYNPNRQGNNGEGGPPDPTNTNEARTDRTNMVQVRSEGPRTQTIMETDPAKYSLFATDASTYQRLAFLDQDVGNPNVCATFATLQARNGNNRDARERDPMNCAKLSGVKTPRFDAGLLSPNPQVGEYHFMNTRNNNFSNRDQKGIIQVVTQADLDRVNNPDSGTPADDYYYDYVPNPEDPTKTIKKKGGRRKKSAASAVTVTVSTLLISVFAASALF